MALCCLWVCGLGTKENYFAELDRLFLQNPEDDFLLELEGLGGDRAAVWSRLSGALPTVNFDEYGRALFCGLEKFFNENVRTGKLTLPEFGGRCYNLWSLLPGAIDSEDPFHILCYADDPLSWGDEKQSRELYQKAFDYYKEKL